MATFRLNVSIDSLILKTQSTDKLVIARKVNRRMNAVFDGYSIAPNTQWKQLLSQNEFTWTENFKVYLTSSTEPGVQVVANTNEVPIGFDYLATYSQNLLTDPTKQGAGSFPKPGCFGINKVPLQYHAAVKMSTAGGAWSTIYVDTDNHVGTTNITLQPQNEYLLMWKNEVSTETIWSLSETDGRMLVFEDGVTTKSIRYGYAKPDSPGAGEEPDWY